MSNNIYANNDLKEVKQMGMWASIVSLGYIFWLVGGMELIERLSYYGVKSSATLYATSPASDGGLGITPTEFGTILMVFALVQTFIPVFSGGLSDRIGYKETIALSTIIKIAGYLFMAWFPTYWGYMAGCVLLAAGTGIFKPGIQGTLVKATKKENGSMAWGIFYQVVNIGGFLGPLVSAHMRQLSWDNLFYTCAAIISLNLLLIFAYKEPGKEERLERLAKIKSGEIKQEFLWKDAWTELKKPVVIGYMLVFSGFWFTFNALFDVLPLHIKEWVDTSIIVKDLFGEQGATNGIVKFLLGMDDAGTKVLPEGMLNLNAGLIMTTCFLFAAMSAKIRITTSMLIGCVFSVVAITFVGMFNFAWFVFFSILLFSIGEMLISPKKNEFMGNIAPADKKAMYLGFVMLPQGIGWGFEGYWGPRLYDIFASKERFSLELLAERGMDPSKIAEIPTGEAFKTLVSFTGENAQALTQLLYQTHNISIAWYIIAGIGSLSGIGIYFYGRWLLKLQNASD